LDTIAGDYRNMGCRGQLTRPDAGISLVWLIVSAIIYRPW
jgi:hypothetical protein